MSTRREVASRGKKIFHDIAALLIKIGLKPNHISIASCFFALLGLYGFLLMAKEEIVLGASLAFLGIQLRLICNLIDGLMAVEGKLSSPQGELYNDVPDRISDAFLILGPGFIAGSYPFAIDIAWFAVVLATMTAYIRVLGASQNVGSDFGGPMAKQHRMAVLNLVILASVIEHYQPFGIYSYGLSAYAGLIIICFGALITCARRLNNIASKLS